MSTTTGDSHARMASTSTGIAPLGRASCGRTSSRSITRSSASSSCSPRCCGSSSAACWRWPCAGNWPGPGATCRSSATCCSRRGGQISPEFYTMLFTMHATMMIFFVIIPILAGRVRQLPDPADDRGRRHGVSQAEHAELLVHVAGVHLHDRQLLRGRRRRRRRLDGLSAAVQRARGRARQHARADAVADRPDLRRHLVDDGLGQLPDDDHQDAGPRHDDVPHAADDLGDVHHRHPAGLRPAGAHGGAGFMQLLDRVLGHRLLPARRA